MIPGLTEGRQLWRIHQRSYCQAQGCKYFYNLSLDISRFIVRIHNLKCNRFRTWFELCKMIDWNPFLLGWEPRHRGRENRIKIAEGSRQIGRYDFCMLTASACFTVGSHNVNMYQSLYVTITWSTLATALEYNNWWPSFQDTMKASLRWLVHVRKNTAHGVFKLPLTI